MMLKRMLATLIAALAFAGCGSDTPTAPPTDTSALEREIDDLKDDLADLKDDLNGLQDEIDTLQEDHNNLKDEVDTLQEDNDNLKSEVDNLQEDSDDLKDDLADLRADSGSGVSYTDYAAITNRMEDSIDDFLDLLDDAVDVANTLHEDSIYDHAFEMEIVSGRIMSDASALNMLRDLFLEANAGPLLDSHDQTIERAYIAVGGGYYMAFLLKEFASSL